jgi:hypothetical protein
MSPPCRKPGGRTVGNGIVDIQCASGVCARIIQLQAPGSRGVGNGLEAGHGSGPDGRVSTTSFVPVSIIWIVSSLRDYATEHLADENAVLVIDETGFLKQGKASPDDASRRVLALFSDKESPK